MAGIWTLPEICWISARIPTAEPLLDSVPFPSLRDPPHTKVEKPLSAEICIKNAKIDFSQVAPLEEWLSLFQSQSND